jgi:hypothetical protein
MNPRWMTVLDMVKIFHIPDLTAILERLSFAEVKFRDRRDAGQGNVALTKEQVEMVKSILSDAIAYCQRVGFDDAQRKIATLWTFIEVMTDRYDISAISIELTNVHSELMGEVFKHKFVQVPKELHKYLDMKNPFGEEVTKAFPSATADLIDAGNCLSLGCNAAVVYHLMRAAEVGLWELGRDRQIPLAQSGKIEFTEWGKIIGEIEIAIQAIQQWPNSRIKEDAHKFYNKAISEIRSFNDGWRRHSAHPRPYQPPAEPDDVLALWGHVFRFMVTLSSKIGDNKYTQLIWT